MSVASGPRFVDVSVASGRRFVDKSVAGGPRFVDVSVPGGRRFVDVSVAGGLSHGFLHNYAKKCYMKCSIEQCIPTISIHAQE